MIFLKKFHLFEGPGNIKIALTIRNRYHLLRDMDKIRQTPFFRSSGLETSISETDTAIAPKDMKRYSTLDTASNSECPAKMPPTILGTKNNPTF